MPEQKPKCADASPHCTGALLSQSKTLGVPSFICEFHARERTSRQTAADLMGDQKIRQVGYNGTVDRRTHTRRRERNYDLQMALKFLDEADQRNEDLPPRVTTARICLVRHCRGEANVERNQMRTNNGRRSTDPR